ncbi:hypothetical protein TSAR_000252 [Trichomalopsis sarcophagae]|uniref:Uncharacterized protein n=1 Tax=Trichomalopsis sarcophagae TaxID=543379 RepID=A0A232F1S1_9HYME|nr:hypothetical protein TSAR_000252 [Trichomalopsis sarcophagae]
MEHPNFSPENLRWFHDACKRNDLELIKQFVEQGYPVNSRADSSFGDEFADYTPLHFAVKNENPEAVMYLLHYGADISKKSANSWSPVHLAYYVSSINLLPTIFDYSEVNTYVNAVDDRGLSHFHICCRTMDDPSYVGRFIDRGADVNQKTLFLSSYDSGFTPLHFAVLRKEAEANPILTLLLKNGADHSLKCEDGLTPLHLACKLDKVCSGMLLLLSGADIVARDDKNRLPLHYIFYRNCTSYLADVIFENIPTDRNYRDFQRLSLLHMACFCGKMSLVDSLLAQGCCPNGRVIAINENGKELLFAGKLSLAGLTPLHMALIESRWMIAEMLLLAGADINAEDDRGNSPLWYSYTPLGFRLSREVIVYPSKVIVAKHVMACQAAGLISAKVKRESLQCGLVASGTYKYMFPGCRAQLERIEMVRIKNGPVECNNLRGILGKNEFEMAKLLTNKSVASWLSPNYLDQLTKIFLVYGYMIKAQVNKGFRRIEKLLEAVDALERLTVARLPVPCSEQILSCLCYDDLESVIEASIAVQEQE